MRALRNGRGSSPLATHRCARQGLRRGALTALQTAPAWSLRGARVLTVEQGALTFYFDHGVFGGDFPVLVHGLADGALDLDRPNARVVPRRSREWRDVRYAPASPALHVRELPARAPARPARVLLEISICAGSHADLFTPRVSTSAGETSTCSLAQHDDRRNPQAFPRPAPFELPRPVAAAAGWRPATGPRQLPRSRGTGAQAFPALAPVIPGISRPGQTDPHNGIRCISR